MIYFYNPSLLDPRAFSTFGLSAKDESQIGRFGTGFKYALAVVMRHGGNLTIRSGGQSYSFTTSSETFRDRNYSQILCNDEPLAFTTDLGRDWQPWQAFREFYANALDENGGVTAVEPASDDPLALTCITVDCPALDAVFDTIDQYFIDPQEKPIASGSGLEVYAGRSVWVYYRGIAIYRLDEPSQFRYNLTGYVELTEDRTAKYASMLLTQLGNGLANLHDVEVLKKCLSIAAPFEQSLNFSVKPTQAFQDAVAILGDSANVKAAYLVAVNKLSSDNGGLSVEGTAIPDNLRFAIEMLRATNYPFDKIPVVVVARGPRAVTCENSRLVLAADHEFSEAEWFAHILRNVWYEAAGNQWVITSLAKQATGILQQAASGAVASQ